MENKHLRFVSLLLCAVMVFALVGCGASGDAEEHDHVHANEVLEQLPPTPSVTSFDDLLVPMAELPAASSEEGDPQPQSEPVPEPDPVVTEAPAAPEQPAATEAPTAPSEPSTDPAPGTSSKPDPATCQHNWVTHSEIITDDCVYGTTWRAYDECTICGFQRSSAWRPDSIKQKGEHTWVVTSSAQGTCPGKTVTYKTCSVCGAGTIEYTGGTGKNGDHEWGPWGETVGDQCTGAYQERRCSVCGAVDKKTVGTGSHAWVWKETPASCTAAGMKWQECTRCHAKQNEQTTTPKAHKWEADDGNCATPIKCTLCGAVVQPAMSHHYSSTYSHDNVQHWRQCTNPGCTQRTDVGAHKGSTSNDCTRLSSCSVCGIAGGSSGVSHNFDGSGGYVISSTNGHQIRCGNPGCTQVSSQQPHDKPGTVSRCGEEIDCVCGYPLVRGNSSHNFGAWTATSSGHSRTCKTCGYVESSTHTSKTTGTSGSCTASVSCSVCGYTLSKGYGSHSFGVWMANGSTHYRACTHPGCTAIESSAHTGGRATCTSAAVCSVCGAAYGSKAPNTHTGGTELRNARPAEKGKSGYTGDTYCLGCGKLISSGTTIKALDEDHTHSFSGSWRSDSSSHWHQCTCGERSAESAHFFVNGKCTVCGMSDPNHKVCSGGSHVGGTELKNAVAAEVGKAGYSGDLVCSACGEVISRGHTIAALQEEHEHEFSVTWRSDGVSHWRDCPCGEITRKAAHSFVNGSCSVCGAADPNAAEVHTHSFGSLHANGQYHWRECTGCGLQAEKTAHVMLNGACMTCGYEMAVMENIKDVRTRDWFYEPVKQVLEAGLLSGGKSAGETTSFKPDEKIVLAELVDAIYRMAGSPAAAAENRFEDVSEDDYYASAASWVTDNNIVDIFGETFEGDKVTTLQEMVTFLWRFAQTAGWDVETTGEADIANPEEIDDYAAEAMAWAVEAGLIEGIDGNEETALTPDGVVTRAEAAAILVNFMEMIEANGLPEIEAGVEEIPA